MRKRDLNGKEIEAINRVMQLIDEECGGKAQEFADRAGIAKASVSHYKHRLHAPSQDHAFLIGKAFDVNPMWVMGFDVPKRIDPSPERAADEVFDLASDNALMEALKLYKMMSPDEQKRIVDMINLFAPKQAD